MMTGPITKPLREDSIREPIRETRTRTRRGGQNTDRFAIPEKHMQPGTSYEWKRETVFNKPDPVYDVQMREQGWLPVDASAMPGYTSESTGAIRRDGLVLMERPMELTLEARAEDENDARNIVRTKEAQFKDTPVGGFDKTSARINKSYERGDISVE